MIFENRINVNVNKDGIHQTESVITVNTRVNIDSNVIFENRMNVNNNKDGIH